MMAPAGWLPAPRARPLNCPTRIARPGSANPCRRSISCSTGAAGGVAHTASGGADAAEPQVSSVHAGGWQWRHSCRRQRDAPHAQRLPAPNPLVACGRWGGGCRPRAAGRCLGFPSVCQAGPPRAAPRSLLADNAVQAPPWGPAPLPRQYRRPSDAPSTLVQKLALLPRVQEETGVVAAMREQQGRTKVTRDQAVKVCPPLPSCLLLTAGRAPPPLLLSMLQPCRRLPRSTRLRGATCPCAPLCLFPCEPHATRCLLQTETAS